MTNQEKYLKLKKEIAKTVLGMYKRANAGHIGTSLSCLDILIYIFFFLKKEEDKFILSKGHAAAALYAVLAKSGHFPEELLETFYQDGTLLSGHPPCSKKLNGIIFGTGSLGHGIPLAAGMAHSSVFSKKDFKVFCVISDGDLNEGSSWEGIMFAAQHKIKNLYLIVDYNKLQGFGHSKDVMNLEPLADKFRHFNFEVAVAENGNDHDSLRFAFEELDGGHSDKPKCLIAHTTKGSGVPYMENRMEWHYLPMDEEQYLSALEHIEKLQ